MLTKNSQGAVPRIHSGACTPRQKNRLITLSRSLSIALSILTISSIYIDRTEAKAGSLQTAVVSNFADSVVIPTYQQLAAQANELVSVVATFANNPSDENLQAAKEAWLNTRNPWEQSEVFAFGPASSLGYDGDLDDWPVNETDVAAVLNSNNPLTDEYITTLQTTQKGFHTIELLLFGTNNDKTASDFTARELELLQGLTAAFQKSANDLTTSWSEGIEGNPPYREVLATAGNPNNPAYPTVDAAVEEIVQGIIGCLDEVANEKIGEPLTTKDAAGFESRFSHNSLNDFKNNLISVENAYLGRISQISQPGESLSDLIASANPQLDTQVKQQLQSAIAAVNEIPNPVETNLTNAEATAKMTTAQNAIATLFETMETQVLPVISR